MANFGISKYVSQRRGVRPLIDDVIWRSLALIYTGQGCGQTSAVATQILNLYWHNNSQSLSWRCIALISP